MAEAKDFKKGDLVTWESQSGGYKKRKTGKVVMVLKPRDNPRPFIRENEIPSSRLKFDGHSHLTKTRLLVEVPRGGKSTMTDFYAPYIEWVAKA